MSRDPSKQELVQRAIAAAVRAHPALERRKAALTEVSQASERCVAAARAWLERGDAVLAEAGDAAIAARKAIGAAWLAWDEQPSVSKDLLALKRALHAAEAAMLAAEAAAWTPARASKGEQVPLSETTEAERCAQAALGAAP